VRPIRLEDLSGGLRRLVRGTTSSIGTLPPDAATGARCDSALRAGPGVVDDEFSAAAPSFQIGNHEYSMRWEGEAVNGEGLADRAIPA
jgi:hypothetical protein